MMEKGKAKREKSHNPADDVVISDEKRQKIHELAFAESSTTTDELMGLTSHKN